MRHPENFDAAMAELIYAGGDVDTNCAMVGALIGANCGMEAIPQYYQEARPDIEFMDSLAIELYQKAIMIRDGN